MTKTSSISPPTLADLDSLAQDALAVLPARMRQLASALVIRVEDFPDDEICAEMDVESPFDLLGLYQGVALGEKQVEDSGGLPDMVFLYRRPILDYWCETGEDLRHVVRHVVIHEIGHHFGFSDEEMEAVEAAAGAEDGKET